MTRLEEPQPLSAHGVELSNGPQAAAARRRSYTALALGVGLMLAGVPLAYAMLRGPNPYAMQPGPAEGGHHVEADDATRGVRAAANPGAPALSAPLGTDGARDAAGMGSAPAPALPAAPSNSARDATPAGNTPRPLP